MNRTRKQSLLGELVAPSPTRRRELLRGRIHGYGTESAV